MNSNNLVWEVEMADLLYSLRRVSFVRYYPLPFLCSELDSLLPTLYMLHCNLPQRNRWMVLYPT